MTHAQFQELLIQTRIALHDRDNIKPYQLLQLLNMEDTNHHRHLAGRLLSQLPEWKRDDSKESKYVRCDVKTAPSRLSITLSNEHRAFLELQKQKFGMSYAASIRSLISQRIENGTSFTSREVLPIGNNQRAFCKVPDAQNISSLNQELKALFARLPCQEQKDT